MFPAQEQGFNPNTVDYSNRTPLHIAAAHGYQNIVDYLLTVGAHVHVHDQFGYTPLRDAVENHHANIVYLLRTDGAQLGMPPNELANRLCTLAAQNQENELRLWLGAGADVNATNFDGRTALHVAASRGHIQCLEVLLSTYRVNFRLKDDFGETAYSTALNHNKHEVRGKSEMVV